MPDKFTVACDYDRPYRPPSMMEVRAALNIMGLRCAWRRDDRTRRGWHMVLHVRPGLRPAERIALELGLGSDRHRGLLDLMRVVWCRVTPIRSNFWRRRTSMLFERKLA